MPLTVLRRFSNRESPTLRPTVEHFRTMSAESIDRIMSEPSTIDRPLDERSSSLHAPRGSIDASGESSTSTPSSPSLLARQASYSSTSSSYQEDWEAFPPLDKITVFDLLDNFALPQQIEKWQKALATQREKVKRQREKIASTGINAKERVVQEWRKRLPTADEQLEKYRKRVKSSVDRLNSRWDASVAVTAREKASFIAGVLNIWISGYLVGAFPQYFYYWYTAQILYFMPVRWYTYHKRGYHYFLADLCYFVNALLLLSLWVFPRSKRLLISTYCLAYGNNAVAIVMWRNSLVFHSLDKVTSLFIHIMPPVALHCLVHQTGLDVLAARFPAIHSIKTSLPTSPEHYSLFQMIVWATVPYMVWQLSYHFFITVRRREKIAAGRPTSFTWLRRSYAKNFLGRMVLSLPDALQEPAFMGIQYSYALLTMLPCPLWFWYRWASAAFLMIIFVWSVYNGATYYIDVFGTRFQKEVEQLKKDVSRLNMPSPNAGGPMTPGALMMTPNPLPSSALDDQESVPILERQRQASSSNIGGGAMEEGVRQRYDTKSGNATGLSIGGT